MERPISGAEERGHADEADAAACAPTWQEKFYGVGGHYEAGRDIFGGWFRGASARGARGGWGGGGKKEEEGRGRPANAFGGREGLGHRFAVAWVRVRAAFGDGYVCAPRVVS